MRSSGSKKGVGTISGAIGCMLLVLLLLPASALGHPHVFIEAEVEVELNAQGIKGLWHYWTFDEYFSAWIIEEFDTTRDGRFNDEETRAVHDGAFQYLAEFGYFTKVLKGKREIPIKAIEKFSVATRGHQVVYTFFVNLDIKVPSGVADITIAVYDEAFYCQVAFPKKEIRFKGKPDGWKIEQAKHELPEFAYYFGFMTPTAVKLTLTVP